jgi:hypothetical protein
MAALMCLEIKIKINTLGSVYIITIAAMGDVWVALVSTRTQTIMPMINRNRTIITSKIKLRKSSIVVTKAVFTAAGGRGPIGMTYGGVDCPC